MASPWLHARLRTPSKRGAAHGGVLGSPHVGASTPLTSPALPATSGRSARFPMSSFGATPTSGRTVQRAPQSAPHNRVLPRAAGMQAGGAAATTRTERVRSRFALVSDGLGGEVAVDVPRAASVASAATTMATHASAASAAVGDAWAVPVHVRRELLPEEVAFAQLFETYGDTSATAQPRAVDAPDAEAADIASEYGRLVQERLDAVSGQGAGADLSMHSVVTANEQRMLGMERDTWVLLEGLLPELVRAAKGGDACEGAVRAAAWDTDYKLVQALFSTHAELRRLRVAVQWLEWVGSDERNTTFVESHVGRSTVVALRTAKSTGKSDATLVTECDPDAPTRQRKQLHADDADKLQYLYAGVWRCLRAGQLAEAQQLCRDFGQFWLAASLGGGAWSADTQLDGSPSGGADDAREGEVVASTGNAARAMWKEACARFAQSPDAGQTQRAVFGLLAGDAEAALPMCGSWTDAAWVYMRMLLDRTVDARLADARHGSDDNDDDGDDAMGGSSDGDDAMDGGASAASRALSAEALREEMRTTVQRLLTHNNDVVRREAAHPFHRIQALLLTGQVNTLAQTLRKLVTDPATTCAPLVQRFAAHALLLLMTAGVLAPESTTACHDVVRVYCTLLTPSHDAHVVALYTAQLPGALQVETFARFLENVDERDERTRCLDYARRRFPEQVDAITRRVVQNVCYVTVEDEEEEDEAEEEREAAGSSDGGDGEVGTAENDGDARMGGGATGATTLGAGMGLDEALASQPPTPVPPIAVRADPRKLKLDRASSVSARTHTTINTNVSDAKRIRSIEWLCFDHEQRAEAVMESNALVRVLVLQGKEEEARKPFVDILPADSIEVIHATWAAKYGGDGAVPHEEELAVREYLMWKAYLECYRAYGEWFSTLHARPERSAFSHGSTRAADSNIAAIRREHEDSVFAQEMARWERTARQQADTAVARLLEVLHFEGGWMRDSDEDEDDVTSNAARLQQLEDLRRLCIPKVVMLLHHVLHSMGEHKRALAVSTLVADERTALYTLFSKAQLQALMDLMRQSAVEVSRSELV